MSRRTPTADFDEAKSIRLSTVRESPKTGSELSMSNVIKDEDLMTLGYRRHPNSPNLNHADWLWQKRIRNSEGDTLYFINIYQYCGMYREYGGGDGWMPEVQLYLDADHTQHVDLTLGGFTDLPSIERFFASAYAKLNCAPDDVAITRVAIADATC